MTMPNVRVFRIALLASMCFKFTAMACKKGDLESWLARSGSVAIVRPGSAKEAIKRLGPWLGQRRPHTRAAIIRALEQYEITGTAIPFIAWSKLNKSENVQARGDMSLIEARERAQKLFPDMPEYGSEANPLECKTIKGVGAHKAFRVQIGDRIMEWRPLRGGNVSAFRKTAFAAAVNDALGFEYVHPAFVARVNGEIGVLSEFDHGMRLTADGEGLGTLSRNEIAGITFFEFLLSNSDIELLKKDRSTVRVWHHDQGIRATLPTPRTSEHGQLGLEVPQDYPSNIQDHFRSLQSEMVKDAQHAFLLENEAEVFNFHKTVLWVDIKTRFPELLIETNP